MVNAASDLTAPQLQSANHIYKFALVAGTTAQLEENIAVFEIQLNAVN